MKRAAELAERARQNGGGESTRKRSSTRGEPPIPREWAETLFARFTAIWPEKMADRLSTFPRSAIVEEWRLGLVGLTAGEIKHGIDRARVECAWPPEIAEFRALATDGANKEQRAFKARLRLADQARALPAETWEERRAVGRRHLAGLRAALSGPPAPDNPPPGCEAL